MSVAGPLTPLVRAALVGTIVLGARAASAEDSKPVEAAPAPSASAATSAPAASPAGAPRSEIASPLPVAPVAPVAPGSSALEGSAASAPPPLPPPPSPPPEPAHPHGAANGIVLQVRLPVGETFTRSFNGPERAVDHTQLKNGPRGVNDVPFMNSTYYVFNGFRMPGFTAGLGFGFYHFSWDVVPPCSGVQCAGAPITTTDGTIFQFSPAVSVPYFKTPDEKTEAYVTASFTLTWAPNLTPQYDPIDVGGGAYEEPDIQAKALGFGGSLGLGGQHFLHPNFALGVESGIFYSHLTVTTDASLDGHKLDEVPDQKGWFLGGYAALTAMVVVGE